MYFTKQYRIEHEFENGTCVFILSETDDINGHWELRIQNNEKASVVTVAEVASGILCGAFTALQNENIRKFRIKMKIGDENLEFYFEKGDSKQRILDEIAQSILVS